MSIPSPAAEADSEVGSMKSPDEFFTEANVEP